MLKIIGKILLTLFWIAVGVGIGSFYQWKINPDLYTDARKGLSDQIDKAGTNLKSLAGQLEPARESKRRQVRKPTSTSNHKDLDHLEPTEQKALGKMLEKYD